MTYVPRRDFSPYVSAPPDWDIGYRNAQAALINSGTPIDVWFLGHSIMAGAFASNESSEGYRWLARNYLVGKFGQSADYFPVTLSQHAADFGSGFTWNGGTPPWVIGATPYNFSIGNYRVGSLGYTQLPYSGMGGDASWINPGDGTDLATFTTQSWLGNCQAFDIVAPNYTAGTSMRWSVDGGSTTNITFTADGRNQVLQPAGLAGLSNASHTILFEGVGATGQPWLGGVTAHKTTRGAPGVRVAHLAAHGAVVPNYDQNYWTNTLLGRDAATGTVGAGLFPMNPDLVICSTTAEDIMGQLRIQQIIECIRRASPYCSFIFIADYHPNGITTDSSYTPDPNSIAYMNYITMTEDIANRYDCAFVDAHRSWQGRGLELGYTTSNEIHPTSAGHAAHANNLLIPLL